MKIRNIAFGWQYEGGKIVLQEGEASVLRDMYQAYKLGKSLAALVEKLEALEIEYQEGKTDWNKSRVRRLLSDKRYLGTEEYPAIIDPETFEPVQKRLKEANQQAKADRKADIYQIHNVRCDRCGAIMKRRTSYSGKRYEKWVCQNKSCHIIAYKPDVKMIEDLLTQLNHLIENPQEIRYEKKTKESAKPRTHILSKLPIEAENEDAYQRLTAQTAAAYSRLDTNEYLTQRLREDFKEKEPLSVFSWELYARTVKEVRIEASGNIHLVLKNDQRIGGCEDGKQKL